MEQSRDAYTRAYSVPRFKPGVELAAETTKAPNPKAGGGGQNLGLPISGVDLKLLPMPFRFTILAAALIVVGCGNATGEKPVKTRQQRMAEAEAVLNKGPVQRSYKMEGGELKVVDVPVSGYGGLTSKSQQCFVWRDAEFRTASLACPHQPELVLGHGDPDLGMADTAR